jgi:AraC-like DNA-binding protein
MRLIDVALASGFSSHAHLSRVFKRVIGETPSEYRRSLSPIDFPLSSSEIPGPTPTIR